MKNVVVLGGSTAVVSGVKVSSRLSVIAPDGMSGAKLARWKKRNESALLNMVESGVFGSLPAEDSKDEEGDSSSGE